MQKVGIFGGTFNPIHSGHVKAALGFIEAAGLDRLIVIPDKIPPHKIIVGEDHPEIRFHMTKLAFDEVNKDGKITVSDMEIRREGKSFSYYTMKELTEAGVGELYLYCGTDMLLSFDKWFRFEDLLSMCTLAYAGREVQSEALRREVEDKITLLREKYGARILVIPLDPIATSSSEVRDLIANGEDASHLLPPVVYEYIKENKLYSNDTGK
jgi:nicotinate-nucleotide adenylyltransferase